MWRSALLTCAAAALVATAVAAGADDPLDPKIRISKADQAAAAAAVLRQSDLGRGWAGGATAPTSMKAPRCPAQSLKFHDLTLTGHAEALYHLDSLGWQIDSDATVLKSAKQVASQYKRLFTSKLAACVKYDVLKTTGNDPNVKLGITKRINFPHLAPVAALYRTSIAYKSGKQIFTIYSDTLLLSKGRTQLWLNFVAPSTDEGPLELREQEIAKALLERVRV